MIPLYSLHGAWPQEMHFRVRIADGGSRTDPETFTPEELAEWGYTGPYQKPAYDPRAQYLEWTGDGFIVLDIGA